MAQFSNRIRTSSGLLGTSFEKIAQPFADSIMVWLKVTSAVAKIVVGNGLGEPGLLHCCSSRHCFSVSGALVSMSGFVVLASVSK